MLQYRLNQARILMKKIMFTKHLGELDVPGIAAALQTATVEGADLCVRDGYPVNPDNIHTALPEAAKTLAAEGLTIPLVTAPGDFTRPDIDYAERYYGACSEAGVGHVKLGYWHWNGDVHYWDFLDQVRGWMDGFQQLSEKTGVKTVVHNHSGASMGLNSCAAMNVVKGFDPAHVGVFTDCGHLSICGEPIEMAADIVRDYVAVFALKDLARAGQLGGGTTGAGSVKVVRFGHGFVDWQAVAKGMKAIGFDGPVSFHSEYAGEMVETVVDLCRIDVRFFDQVLAGAG